jgi:hypothetical protein
MLRIGAFARIVPIILTIVLCGGAADVAAPPTFAAAQSPGSVAQSSAVDPSTAPFATQPTLAALPPFADPPVGGEQSGPGRGATHSAPAVVLVQGEGQRAMHRAPWRSMDSMEGADAPQSTVFLVDWMEGEISIWGYACDAWPAGARAAFEYALALWGTQIASPVPVRVAACWASLGVGVLGISGPAEMGRDFDGAPHTGTWYPVALVNALAGYDWNDTDGWDADRDGSDVDPEINVCLNRTFSRWYDGLDGNVPWNRYDLVTAAMHEVGHGLGFISSMQVAADVGSWGLGTPYPLVYDHLLQNGEGWSLLDDGHYPNPSPALGSQLLGQGGGVYLDGTQTRAAGGGERVPVYAPPVWEQGASISHLDTVYYGSVNALMTKTLFNGQAVHDPGPIARGVLGDIGWPAYQPDLSISAEALGGIDLSAGDPVTVVLSVGNGGNGLASGVVLSTTLSSGLTELSWVSSSSLAGAQPVLTTEQTWVWDLPDLTPGAHGAITITGAVDGAVSGRPAIWVRAAISSAEVETDPGDNASTTLVGGYRAYTPLVLRDGG